MGTKAGFKMTEAGVIPEDWQIVPLGNVITEFRGGASLKPSDFTSAGVKVLPKGGVGRTGWLDVSDADIQYCPVEYADRHRRNQVDETFTIVVLRDLVPSGPSIGLMIQIRDRQTYVLAQGVYGFKVSQRAVSGYLVQLSNTQWYRKLANSIMVGSTQVHITNTAFKLAQIPLPAPAEQNAIARALSDADALIESLEQLITKKRHLKQGTMQELLTGKKRLPGFGGEWEVKRLGDVVITIPGGIYGVENPSDGLVPMPVATTAHISDDDQWNGKAMQVRYFTENQIAIYAVQDGDLVVVKSSGSAASIKSGKIGLVSKEEAGAFVFSNFLMVLRPKAVISKYLYFYQTSYNVKKLLPSLVEASTYPNIRRNEYLAINIPLPPKEEQTAIATILSDMDAEITALETRLAKTRSLKQGMMHNLLTGKIRLA
jgi:type I restriction enzyme S subunit